MWNFLSHSSPTLTNGNFHETHLGGSHKHRSWPCTALMVMYWYLKYTLSFMHANMNKEVTRKLCCFLNHSWVMKRKKDKHAESTPDNYHELKYYTLWNTFLACDICDGRLVADHACKRVCCAVVLVLLGTWVYIIILRARLGRTV